ncbi:MAG: carboxypeptidase-like regulatory domain-containing protein [Acidobacteria bacterium]|nr:carboxypeptidase-like regulatory domain-containing protein [Acidobacteriota bacterium]
MNFGRRHFAAIGVLSGVIAGVCVCDAQTQSARLQGAILGIVSDRLGQGQLGATVYLYNRFDKLVQRVSTNEKGAFGFDFLPPDSYSVRVSLPAFMPAVRQNILIQPGMRSFLAINLAGVISSVELVYSSPTPTNPMTDDWKWVLRSSMSSRPVLRLLADPSRRQGSIFSDTRGVVRVQAGDGGSTGFGSQPDLGTAFAVATSVLGQHELQVTGNLGYASRGGSPAASFRTRLSRVPESSPLATSFSPQVLLTVRQLFVLGSGSHAPPLSTLSTAFLDRVAFGDRVDVLYGAQLESVTFYDRLNVISPFARLTYKASKNYDVQVAYSSGAPPEEIYRSLEGVSEPQLGQDVGTVSAFPRVSLRDGRAHVQRTGNLEVALRRKLGTKSQLAAVVFEERVANGALTVMGDTGAIERSEVLPDPFSRSSILNVGSYQRRGFMVSADRNWGRGWSTWLGAGNTGTLAPDADLVSNARDVRRLLHSVRRNWLAMRVSGVVPMTGTRVVASYLQTDNTTALPMHRYLTQSFSPEVGLNVQVRQPLPGLGLWSGRLEAIVELRNALSQGVAGLETGAGSRLLLMPSPRTLRGGLAFIF